MNQQGRGGRVRLPSNTELADKLAFGLTARQLTTLGATALLAYAIFSLCRGVLPGPFAAAPAVPVAATGLVLALGSRHGLPGDRYALAAALFLVRPRLRALAPEGIPSPLRNAPARPAISPLDIPVSAVFRSGLVGLSPGGFCRLLRASAAAFALRSDEEQQALVEAFGIFLNGLADPIQIAVRSQPVDLEGWAARLERSLPETANPQLKAAAAAHARFVAALAANAEVRQREILVVLTTRTRERDAAQAELERRAGETVDQLQAAGVELQPLDGDAAAALLGRTLDPPGPPAGVSLTGVVHGC